MFRDYARKCINAPNLKKKEVSIYNNRVELREFQFI